MKRAVNLLIAALIVITFSCTQTNKKANVPGTDTLQQHTVQNKQEHQEKREEQEEEERMDSIRTSSVLAEALNISAQHINDEQFYKEYEAVPDDEYHARVEISLGYHFTTQYPHLLIRRHTPNSVCIDIYAKEHNTFKKVASHEQWVMTYENDTIRDINGDGLKDFVVNWYGSNGCCLKAFSNVYLLKPDKKRFFEDLEFINPTFSPAEGIVRGVCYGQPGETEMYKYKWNNDKLDTIEYVSYERNTKGNKTGKIIISDRQPYSNQYKILKRLNSVPQEYRNIEGYDWFTGNL